MSQVTESFWQQGCDDAKAGREPSIPHPMAVGWLENYANAGYMNGWNFGKALPARDAPTVHEPAEDEGSQP